MSLRVAIVHYHLKPGGVTRVIENAVASLEGREVETVVLSGVPYEGGALDRTRTVPGLDYQTSHQGGTPKDLARSMMRHATEALGGAPDVWHIHNHSLGKNSAMPGAVADLIAQGVRILFQIHDFAEDGRPSNHAVLMAGCQDGSLYPVASQIHYSALNVRDTSFLAEAGIPTDRLHTLANPVAVPGSASGKRIQLPDVSRLFLYPTRGIRRKNLGEMVLWSAMGEPGDHFSSTLAPANPEWLPIHSRWVEFASELKLPVAFDVGRSGEHAFMDWITTADALMTTSVAEGFGLAFLEPWGFEKPLVGRNLPEITADFGMDLSMLYDRMDVPLELVKESSLRARLQTGLEAYYAAYGRDLPVDAVERSFQSVVRQEKADFGALDEPLQEQVIRKVAGSRELQAAICPNSLGVELSVPAMEANRERVRSGFSIEAYGKRLEHLYRSVAKSPIESNVQSLNPESLLECFLAPERFCLLRT